MADPAPLTDDEIDAWRARVERAEHRRPRYEYVSLTVPEFAGLVATVEQMRRERDDAYAVICQLTDDWDPEEQADPCAHAWTPDEVDAIRRARAAPGAEEDQ